MLSRDHLLVYYGSKNQYTVAIFCKKMSSRFATPVSDSKERKLRSSAIPVNANACTKWGIKHGQIGQEQELLKLTQSLE